jgi:anhydro-N-acetylmuramic acid kinase
MALYLGLISGTSMDAVDAALVEFGAGSPLTVVAASATPYEPSIKGRLAALMESPDRAALDDIGQIDVELGRAFAAAANALLAGAGISPARVSAIGSHGQTLRHRTDLAVPFTWQIADPNTLAELTGISVVADFRRRDVAAGGQGAPLVPAFHEHVFRSAAQDRVIANVGGIANVTVLKRGAGVIGFDTGPGNRLMDAWISRHQGLDFDRGGAWAGSGRVDDTLLQRLLKEPYLALPAPKSTGRELFNPAWLERQLEGVARAPADVQATLQEYTARTLAAAVRAHAPAAALYVCGGGAHNAGLLAALARLLAPQAVSTTLALGLNPDYVEAVAFAWFAKRTLEGQPSSLASVTGAHGARVLGGVYHP